MWERRDLIRVTATHWGKIPTHSWPPNCLYRWIYRSIHRRSIQLASTCKTIQVCKIYRWMLSTSKSVWDPSDRVSAHPYVGNPKGPILLSRLRYRKLRPRSQSCRTCLEKCFFLAQQKKTSRWFEAQWLLSPSCLVSCTTIPHFVSMIARSLCFILLYYTSSMVGLPPPTHQAQKISSPTLSPHQWYGSIIIDMIWYDAWYSLIWPYMTYIPDDIRMIYPQHTSMIINKNHHFMPLFSYINMSNQSFGVKTPQQVRSHCRAPWTAGGTPGLRAVSVPRQRALKRLKPGAVWERCQLESTKIAKDVQEMRRTRFFPHMPGEGC